MSHFIGNLLFFPNSASIKIEDKILLWPQETIVKYKSTCWDQKIIQDCQAETKFEFLLFIEIWNLNHCIIALSKFYTVFINQLKKKKKKIDKALSKFSRKSFIQRSGRTNQFEPISISEMNIKRELIFNYFFFNGKMFLKK